MKKKSLLILVQHFSITNSGSNNPYVTFQKKLSDTEVNPKEIIQQAYDVVQRDQVKGGTTILLGVLGEKKLKIASLGDCGLLILRNKKVVFKTKEQHHSFNFPFQLGLTTRSLPEEALPYDVDIQEDDIILAGSDGFFDNLFEDQILEIIEEFIGNKKLSELDPSDLCRKLLKEASYVARNTTISSPFEAIAVQHGIEFKGGKMDDISLIVAFVESS